MGAGFYRNLASLCVPPPPALSKHSASKGALCVEIFRLYINRDCRVVLARLDTPRNDKSDWIPGLRYASPGMTEAGGVVCLSSVFPSPAVLPQELSLSQCPQ